MLKRTWHAHKSSLILILSVLLIVSLPTLLYLKLKKPVNKDQTTASVVQPQPTSVPVSTPQNEIASLADNNCTAQAIACDQQFKDNKTLACGTFKGQAVDELLKRDESPCKGMDKAYVEAQVDEACQKGCLPQPTSTNTPTPTSSPTPSPTPTSTPTPSPTPTLTPSPTTTPNALQLNLKLTIPGIGNSQWENSHPLHNSRTGTIQVFDNSTDTKITEAAIDVLFDSTTTSYATLFIYSNAENGKKYYLKVKLNGTLIKRISGTYAAGPTATTPTTLLVPGDLDTNNEMGVQDYNLMVGCYKALPICTQELKDVADLNDNGTIDIDDLNILQRAFAIGRGDLSANR